MPADKFALAVEFVLSREGGYVNDPQDPGGETKCGISKRSYPTLDIANMTKQQAIAIYKRDFWDRCHCDAYDYPLALAVFDTAVNCGVGKAIAWVKDCGGRATHVLFLRSVHYVGLNKPRYFSGWMNRVAACYKEGMKYV
jgi:lysozyme family protein